MLVQANVCEHTHTYTHRSATIIGLR